jgi:hypothetical protein
MSEEQAKETKDEVIEETIVDETLEGKEASADTASEEVEIIVEGEEKPASKAKPNGFKKRVAKLNGKIEEANTATEEVTRRANALEEENRLLRLNAQQGNPDAEPNEDDFDTDAEYRTAKKTYDDKRIAAIAVEKASEIIQASQSKTTQVNNDRDLEDSIGKHYERVESLNMSSYEELEDKAIDVLGNDFAKMIIAKTKKSHLIMGHLGANIGKAEELSRLLKSDPVGALIQAVEIGETLSTRPKNSTTPDPETKIEPGEASPTEQHQQKLDKLRDEAAANGDMTKLIAFKKQMTEAGVKLR